MKQQLRQNQYHVASCTEYIRSSHYIAQPYALVIPSLQAMPVSATEEEQEQEHTLWRIN